MICASCRRTNPAGARFCGGCGTSLAPRCPACGVEAQADAHFCNACGASLADRPAETAIARKVVTIVFADLIGSVSLHERLDAESARRVMDRYHRAMSAAVDVHGGRVVQLLGDGVLAAFGVPRVAEDDAIRAVRAAVGMQRAFRELAREQGAAMQGVGLRVAVNTGEIVVGDDENSVMGDPTNVAARLQQEARDGDVIVGEGTQRLVGELVTLAPLGTFVLRGRAETVAAYRVVTLDPPASRQALAFVGRDDELRRLVSVYDSAVATPAARLAVLLGSPGLGKSRLVAEFTRRAAERATVLAARCDAAGGATFAPLADTLRGFLRIEEGAGGDVLRAAIDAVVPGDEAERARIATGLGALLSGAAASPEETFFAVRRLLAALAALRPVVLVIDDLQWAEPLLLDLVEHLVQWSSGVPLLLLVAARPELRDARSALTMPGAFVTDVVTLGGLDAGAATRLAANVIGGAELPAALAGRVLATSEGNPLFVAELVRMLVQDGTLVREGDRWITTVEVSKLDMPPTIQVLLAARIERLRPEERSVLERAAVIGRHFSRAAVAHLLPHGVADLDARLEALRRSELIEPDTGWFLGEPALRFHHVLIRDAAYRRVLKETRAELHERLADWITARAGESVEHDETIGWHLEQAHQNLRELGPLDAHGKSLGERAAHHLGAAGRRALARDDLSLAAGLLGRALDRLDPDDAARAALALDWCEALLSAGDVGPAVQAIAELGRFTGDSDRLRAWHACFTGQLAVLTEPQALRASADTVAAAAETLTAAGDAAGEAKAHAVRALALARLGKIGACEAALDRALAAARHARDRRRVNAVLAGAPLAALWGPSPVTRASGRCLDVVRVLRITQSAPAVEAVALRCQAVLETLRGRADAARRMIASSRHMLEELGITQRLLEADMFTGLIELLEGDAAAAERWLRTAFDGLREHGLGIDAAQAAALLGRALLAQGRSAEAEALSHDSEALAGDDFKAAIAWRGVRAEALARRGEHAAAVELARAAVEIAAATDDLLDHADARLALAVVLRAAGRGTEADTEESRAIELWEAKGATLLAERARRDPGRSAPLERQSDGLEERASSDRRRVRPNAATADAARLEAAVAARDADALVPLFADLVEVVEHATGVVFDGHGMLTTWRALLRAENPSIRNELLATLGDSLALFRGSMSFGALAEDDDALPIGAVTREELVLIEVGSNGRHRRLESYAPDHLGDALARLYERYAELLPDGPARERAAGTASSVAAMMLGQPDLDRWSLAFAPDIEFVDSRTVGFGSIRGVGAVIGGIRTLIELTDGFATRIHDVIAVRPDALLVRWSNFGRLRAGGGDYERDLCELWLFGSDGRLERWEQFDADRVVEALARLDELTAGPTAAPRRVRPNAATANTARVDPTHEPTHAQEPLATLGDSLALYRQSFSADGTLDDVGAFESEAIILIEVYERGQRRRTEFFAGDRLGDAIARLYERYAELFPDGAGRARAAATARSVAALLGPPDLDAYHTAFAPDVELSDRRTLGWGSIRGREALMRGFHGLFETSDDIAVRVDDVLGLASDAVLMRWTISGIDRAGGGVFERHFLLMWAFGAEGLVTRSEQFDVDHAAAALARFDELGSERPRPLAARVRSNFATESIEAALAARDADAFARSFAPHLEVVHHPTGVSFGLNELIERVRMTGALAMEPRATLGDALVLCRAVPSSAGATFDAFDTGAWEHEYFEVTEADAAARTTRLEIFAADRLGDAVARLYERYAELLPDGPERVRAAATARSVATNLGPFDVDAFAPTYAPAVEFVDHRTLGFESVSGSHLVLQRLRSLAEVSADIATRVDDVLALRPDAVLLGWSNLGTERVGGGAFEHHFLILYVFGADGLVTRSELFNLGREQEALARFDELTSPRLAIVSSPAEARRVRPNAATEHATRADAAINARDADALAALTADAVEIIDHTTGTVMDHRGHLATWRGLMRARGPRYRHEPLATLGESLALSREFVSASGSNSTRFDVGAYESELLPLAEVDSHGRLLRCEIFASDRLGAAIARLYERYAELLPEGVERTRATATARTVATSLGPFDVDAYGSAYAPHVEFVDHRTLGFESVSGSHLVLQRLRSLAEVSADIATRVDDVLALRPDAVLLGWSNLGTERVGGGAFEHHFLILYVFGADGLVTRSEQFDSDRDADALARLDELTARALESRIENAATRANARMKEAARARDFERFAAMITPGHQTIDRRRSMRIELSREEMLAGFQPIYESASRLDADVQVLATRGDRLALFRERIYGEVGLAGASEVEFLQIIGVDERGELVLGVVFDPDDLDAAFAELDERYAAGEAAAYAEIWGASRRRARAHCSRDWEQLASLLPADLVTEDHRPVRFGTVRSRDEYIAMQRTLIALSSDAMLRIEHVLGLDDRGMLHIARWVGTREGGAFEIQVVLVIELDLAKRVRHQHLYDLEQLDTARARFAALRTAPSAPRIENAATRAADRLNEAWEARDWERLADIVPAGFRCHDRRRLVQLELDRDQYLVFMRALGELDSTRFESQVLATRGDRLALARLLIEVADQSVGPSEIESLMLTEVDDHGEHVATIRFDPDDLDAAYAELDARFAAGEATSFPIAAAAGRAFAQALAARDWDALSALFAPDFVLEDHRPLGWEPIRSPAAYVAALRSLAELAPDARPRLDHLELCARGWLAVATWLGTRWSSGREIEGGSFESQRIVVLENDGLGRARRQDFYDLDQLDAARARFDAIGAGAARDPLAAFAKPNAASAAMDRVQAAFEARDWIAMRAVCTPDAKIDDRRRHALVSLDADAWVADARVIVQDADVHYQRQLVSTAGDRVVLERVVWTGQADGGPFEVEYLAVTEVDERGSIAAVVAFGLDDRRAASAEMLDRDPHGDALKRAMDDHDLDRLRAALPEGFVLNDHRRTGLGKLGRDDYLDSLAVLFEQAPDVILETLYTVAAEKHANLIAGRLFGTLASGGEFESVFVRLASFQGDQLVGMELFEPEDLDVARARFAELRPDPLRIPPNAATRASGRLQQVLEARDWDALALVCAPTMVFDDRRHAALLTGNRDMFIASNRVIGANQPRLSRTLLATAGDQLALQHLRWTGETPDVAAYEAENLSVIEVDAEGRITAIVAFDPDDRRAASIEMFERYARSEGACFTPPATIEVVRAMNEHDARRVRAALPQDFFFHDHRRTGVGRIENADDYVDSLVAMWEMSPDMATDTLYHVAVEEHGSFNVGRMFGTLADGGAFESIFVRLGWYENRRNIGVEVFELEDLDRARALFEARRRDPLRIPPNAAARAGERLRDCALAADWGALRKLCAPIVFEDRRPLFRMSGDCELIVANTQAIDRSIWERATRTLLATAGDRLALHRQQWRGSEAAPFEIDTLEITEVDADGRILAAIVFAPDDRRAANAEMSDRYFRSEEARSFPAASARAMRALIDHDLEGLRAVLPGDFVMDDHRRTGVGRIEGAALFTQSMAALFEQAPDLVPEPLYTIAVSEYGALDMAHMFGTLAASGGDVESFYVRLFVYRGDRMIGMELFEPEDLDMARARFEELRPDPLRIPPNAAAHAMERFGEAALARNWDAVEALLAPAFIFEDRRRGIRMSGDRATMLESIRLVASSGFRWSGELLATAGNRLALSRNRFWSANGETLLSEIETLQLEEVDADGRLVAHVVFDPDDRRAAAVELRERCLRNAEGRLVPASLAELARALDARDLDRVRAALDPAFVFDDHRRTGVGRIEDIDAYIASIAALFEQTSDGRSEDLYYEAIAPHGSLGIARTVGTLASGGAFESIYVRLQSYRDGRHVATELFELKDLDIARARFEALRPEPGSGRGSG